MLTKFNPAFSPASASVYGPYYSENFDTRYATIHEASYGISAQTVSSARTIYTNGDTLYLDESIATASTPSALKCAYAPGTNGGYITLFSRAPTTRTGGKFYTFTASTTVSIGFGYTASTLGWPADGTEIYADLGQLNVDSLQVAIYARGKTGTSVFTKWVPGKINFLNTTTNYEYLEDDDDSRVGPFLRVSPISFNGSYGTYPDGGSNWYSTSASCPSYNITAWGAYDNPAPKLFYSGSGYDGQGFGFWRQFTFGFVISAYTSDTLLTLSAYSACVRMHWVSGGNPTWYYKH